MLAPKQRRKPAENTAEEMKIDAAQAKKARMSPAAYEDSPADETADEGEEGAPAPAGKQPLLFHARTKAAANHLHKLGHIDKKAHGRIVKHAHDGMAAAKKRGHIR